MTLSPRNAATPKLKPLVHGSWKRLGLNQSLIFGITLWLTGPSIIPAPTIIIPGHNAACCASPLRATAIEAAHSAGHLGFEQTLATLQQAAYWPSMRRDTRQHIERCLICKEKSNHDPGTQLGQTPVPLYPWHTVGIDLLQLPTTKHHNKYLLVVVYTD